MPDEQQPERPPVYRTIETHLVEGVNLSDPDANGARQLAVTMRDPGPSDLTAVLVLNEAACTFLKERLNGGIAVASPGDVAKVANG